MASDQIHIGDTANVHKNSPFAIGPDPPDHGPVLHVRRDGLRRRGGCPR
jgi:hypothetical protein